MRPDTSAKDFCLFWLKRGHEVVCCVRDVKRFNPPESLKQKITVIEMDLLNAASLERIPRDIDGAYYLVHSMASSNDYKSLEKISAINFRNALAKTDIKTPYLSKRYSE